MSRSQRRRPGRLYTLLAALVSLGLVIGACLAAASLYLDSEAFKSELSETLSGLLGREVALKGDLGVSVYPWLGVETGPVEIRDGRDFGLESFISARGVAAAVKLLPLVSGEVVLSTVTVKGMEVNLVRLADGRTNWGDLFSFLSPGPGQAKPVESAEALKVSVLGLKLEDASFSFRDDRLGQRYRLSGVDLSTGMFVPGEPLAFSLDFDFRTRLLKLAAGVRLQGSLETGNRAGAIDKAVLHVLLGGRFLPDSSPKAEFLANLDFDPWAQTLALSDFRMKTLGLDLSGYFKGERIFENPVAEGRLEIKPFDPRQLAGLFFKDAFKDAPKDVLRRAAFCAELSVNDKSADFKDLTLVLDDTRISGSISSKGFFRQPDYVFDLRVDQLDLDRYIPLFITPEPFVIGDFFPDLFHGLRAEGRIEVAALRLMARDLGRVGLGLVSGPDGARLSLDPVKALGGSLSAELKGLVGPAQDEARTVLLSAALKIAGAEAKALPLARDLGLSGRANLDLSLSMPGTAFRLKDPALMALARTSAVLDLALAQGAVAPAKSWPGLEFSKARLTARLKPDMGLTPGNDLAHVVALDLGCAGRAPGRSFAAELNGPALTDGDFKTLKLKAAALKASQKGGLVFKPLPDAVLSARASLDTAARGLSLAELSLTALGLEATGGLEVERLFKDDWKVTARLSVPGSDPKGLLSGLDLKPPKPSDPAVWGRLSGSCEATATAQGAVLSKLNLTLDQTEVQGQVNVEGLERPRYVFALQA
ncbi:MAG: AsmA family protein, partial [Desulfovibrionaceae bacterium]|nr:AsmA family protein [Desulfovibrionaceae bacterium]